MEGIWGTPGLTSKPLPSLHGHLLPAWWTDPEGSRCGRNAPLFTGNASNSSSTAGRVPCAHVITSGRCRQSRCPPRLEPSVMCRRSGPPSVGQPGPTWSLDLLASPGSPPPPTHGEDGHQGPLPSCRPRWAAGTHTLETISPPRLPAIHGLNTPAVWETLPLSFLPIKSPRAAHV